jgi:large subunit ribosomal protein L23
MANKTTERMYQILVKPIITEKTSQIAENNVLTFEVSADSNKTEIKQAVETLYGVKVERVNTLIQQGKTKRFKGHLGRRSDVKKAMVKLADGHNIDVSAGV